MDTLPTTIIQHIHEYDNTYTYIFDKVSLSFKLHCFTYRCSECCSHYNECYCYCTTCRTFLRFCKQLYFDSNSMTEDDAIDIVPMTNSLFRFWSNL